MSIRIDGKEQIFAATFIVRDGQEAEVAVPIPGAVPERPLRLSFVFTQHEPGSAESRVPGGSLQWRTDELGVVRLTFTGWDNPLGTALTDPQKFGMIGRQRVYLQVAQRRLGVELNLVHLHLFLEVEGA